MRVLVLSSMYPNESDPGFGIFVHRHVQALLRKGVDATVVSSRPWVPFPLNLFGKAKTISRFPWEEQWEGVQVYRPARLSTYGRFLNLFYPYYGEWIYRASKSLVARLWSEQPFDLIDAHIAVSDGRAGVIFARDYNIPVTITLHGHSLLKAPQHGSRLVHKIEEALHQADRLVVNSRWLQEVGCSPPWEVESAYFSIINLGVALEERSLHPDKEIAARYQRKRILIAPGYLAERKCHRHVIEAVARLVEQFPNLHLILIGDGPLRDDLKEQAKRLGISDKVEFTGILKQQDVFRYFSIAEAIVLPSYNEAFGNVYIEAAAHGKPFIACKGEGIEDFTLAHRCGLLVPNGDIDALTEAIRDLLENPDKSHEMGQRGKAAVEAEYTWERNAEKYLELWERLIEQKKQGRKG